MSQHQLPKNSRKKVWNNERQLAEEVRVLCGLDIEILPMAYNADEDWVRFDDFILPDEKVLEAYKAFKPDPHWDADDWEKRLHVLLRKDEDKLTDDEERELTKLQRKALKKQLGVE